MALLSSPSPQRGISATTDSSQYIRDPVHTAASPGWMEALGGTEVAVKPGTRGAAAAAGSAIALCRPLSPRLRQPNTHHEYFCSSNTQ